MRISDWSSDVCSSDLERNWCFVLGKIKESLDVQYPAKLRQPRSEGAEVEGLYASLEAVKTPWRNATMHVETIYQPHEAAHIIQCVNLFILRLANLCNEDGIRVYDLPNDIADRKSKRLISIH